MYIDFKKHPEIGQPLLKWWEGLDENRGDRDVLRRASTISAVCMAPPYQRLYRRLLDNGWGDKTRAYKNDALAAAVGVLAHVKTNNGRPPAKAMSQTTEGDRLPVSELRFIRLL